MIVFAYNFDPVTGEFTSSALADASPLEPGQFLVPANATLEAPPLAGPNQVAVFSGGAWSLLPDLRNAALYSTETGERIAVTAIGDVPANATTKARPNAGHQWNAEAQTWQENPAKAAVVAKETAQATINRLESIQLLPRAVREFMLLSLEAQATPQQLAKLASYVKLKAFDEQIAELRAIIRAAP